MDVKSILMEGLKVRAQIHILFADSELSPDANPVGVDGSGG
jgi:hypothetical protein